MSIQALNDGVIGREGGFVDDPRDRGGATRWGITERVARKHGYSGPMRELPREVAFDIYQNEYVTRPGYSAVAVLSSPIAEELIDTGVNMGPATATMMLQRALNSFNKGGADYPDLRIDGDCGPGTLNALKTYLKIRGKEGEAVMLRVLNGLQIERYVDLCEKRPANEAFFYGWIARRAA
jgi:lysozyme family protein